MTIGELYKAAENAGAEIIVGDFSYNKSMSILDNEGKTHIALHNHFETTADERVHLAHEIGHCVRGAFYNIYSSLDARGKHERRADEWAIMHLVPKARFFAACRRGAVYPYQIAEEFNITAQFAEKAMKYYLGEV